MGTTYLKKKKCDKSHWIYDPHFFFLDFGKHRGIQGRTFYLWLISSKVSTSLLQQSKTTLRWLTSKKRLWTVSTSPDDSPLNPTLHPISKIMGNQSKRCSRTSPWLSICHVGWGGGMNVEGYLTFSASHSLPWLKWLELLPWILQAALERVHSS